MAAAHDFCSPPPKNGGCKRDRTRININCLLTCLQRSPCPPTGMRRPQGTNKTPAAARLMVIYIYMSYFIRWRNRGYPCGRFERFYVLKFEAGLIAVSRRPSAVRARRCRNVCAVRRRPASVGRCRRSLMKGCCRATLSARSSPQGWPATGFCQARSRTQTPRCDAPAVVAGVVVRCRAHFCRDRSCNRGMR